jgi:predicted hydrocarbon binding protein
MHYPKDVMVWEFAPGRRLAEFIIKLKNTKGALATCSEVIAKYNINLLSGFHSTQGSSQIGIWSFFADMTDSKVEPEEIVEAIKKLPIVEGVEVFPSDNGFIVDDKHFPVRWSSGRVMMLRTEAAREMMGRLWDVFGSGSAAIINQMAESVGRFSAQEIIRDFGMDFVIQNLTSFLNSYTALGIGELKVRRYSADKVMLTIQAKELFECQGESMLKPEMKSLFFKGHLKGFISTIFNTEVSVMEIECAAAGGEACIFEVAKLSKMNESIASIVSVRRTSF